MLDDAVAISFEKRRAAFVKLDPNAAWTDTLIRKNTKVMRAGERTIQKCWTGHLSPFQQYEKTLLLAIGDYQTNGNDASDRACIKRVISMQNAQVDPFARETWLQFEDYGPDLVDWFVLLGPPPTVSEDSKGTIFLDAHWLLTLVRQLLEALYPFHLHGFVHADLKASNIAIRNKPEGRYAYGASRRTGSLNLLDLTVIDVGCSLLPADPDLSYNRALPFTTRSGTREYLYIGCDPIMVSRYIRPNLLGIKADDIHDPTVVDALRRRLSSGEPWFDAAKTYSDRVNERGVAGLLDNAYISDHYYWACAMYALGIRDPLKKLDWRIDFHSLGCLVASLLTLGRGIHVSPVSGKTKRGERIFSGTPEAIRFLRSLPALLREYDTWPYQKADSELPHYKIITAIDRLIPSQERTKQLQRDYDVYAEVDKERHPIWQVTLNTRYFGDSMNTEEDGFEKQSRAAETELPNHSIQEDADAAECSAVIASPRKKVNTSARTEPRVTADQQTGTLPTESINNESPAPPEPAEQASAPMSAPTQLDPSASPNKLGVSSSEQSESQPVTVPENDTRPDKAELTNVRSSPEKIKKTAIRVGLIDDVVDQEIRTHLAKVTQLQVQIANCYQMKWQAAAQTGIHLTSRVQAWKDARQKMEQRASPSELTDASLLEQLKTGQDELEKSLRDLSAALSIAEAAAVNSSAPLPGVAVWDKQIRSLQRWANLDKFLQHYWDKKWRYACIGAGLVVALTAPLVLHERAVLYRANFNDVAKWSEFPQYASFVHSKAPFLQTFAKSMAKWLFNESTTPLSTTANKVPTKSTTAKPNLAPAYPIDLVSLLKLSVNQQDFKARLTAKIQESGKTLLQKDFDWAVSAWANRLYDDPERVDMLMRLGWLIEVLPSAKMQLMQGLTREYTESSIHIEKSEWWRIDQPKPPSARQTAWLNETVQLAKMGIVSAQANYGTLIFYKALKTNSDRERLDLASRWWNTALLNTTSENMEQSSVKSVLNAIQLFALKKDEGNPEAAQIIATNTFNGLRRLADQKHAGAIRLLGHIAACRVTPPQMLIAKNAFRTLLAFKGTHPVLITIQDEARNALESIDAGAPNCAFSSSQNEKMK